MHEIKLPELGEGIKSATLACWHFNPGDDVSELDDICEVVTDKATFNIQVESKGRIKEIMYGEGDDISVGSVIAVIE